jgi:hypothetical protein
MEHKILLGCPISSPRDWILPTYLEHIKNIQFDKKQIILYFLANNIVGNELSILKKFRNENKYSYLDIIIENINSPKIFENTRDITYRQKYIYEWLAFLRNKLQDKTVELNCSHFFSVDSDILVKPDILNRLLLHRENVVSSLIFNGYLHIPQDAPKDYDTIANAYKFPNILKEISPRQYQHIVNCRTKNPYNNPVGTLVEVAYTGACVLMTKEVCKKARYGNLIILDINDPSSFSYGEDEPWSWSARKAGFRLFCDISMYSQHVMHPSLLEKFKDF